MVEALRLAERGRGWTSPNPVVGAVVVKDGAIAGRGWHKQFGGPHAEVNALAEAGPRARGATLYCTLEPCNHTGKTPPCTRAVIGAGVAQVVLGARDPNPLAAGGIAALRDAGIEVVTDVREPACRRINAPFFKVMATGLPLVSVKWAMTADGKIAAAGGDSKWITGEVARGYAHRLRAQHDAVLVGIGTVRADAPLLNCRVPDAAEVKQPRRVILDSHAATPLDAPLWDVPGGGQVVIAYNQRSAPRERVEALRGRGADMLACEAAGEELPVREVLQGLVQRGVLSVLVEGGSRVLGAAVDARLADRAFVFIAPKILGGRDSVPAVGGVGAMRVAESLALREVQVVTLGGDALLCGALSEWEWEGPALPAPKAM